MSRLRALLSFCDMIALLTSPLIILLFVVLAFVLVERYAEHHRFLDQLETSGQEAWAIVGTGKPSEQFGYYVTFRDTTGAERSGFLKPDYYTPDVVQTVRPGAEVRIRYLAPSYESAVVLADHLDAVRAYWGFAYDVLIILGVSWVWLVFYPDFLYIGYVKDDNFDIRRRFK